MQFSNEPGQSNWGNSLVAFVLAAGALAASTLGVTVFMSQGEYHYSEFTIAPLGIAGCLGFAFRYGPGKNRANIGMAVLCGLLALIVTQASEFIIAHSVVNKILALKGEATLPILMPVPDMLNLLIDHYSDSVIPLFTSAAGIGFAVYLNLVHKLEQPR